MRPCWFEQQCVVIQGHEPNGLSTTLAKTRPSINLNVSLNQGLPDTRFPVVFQCQGSDNSVLNVRMEISPQVFQAVRESPVRADNHRQLRMPQYKAGEFIKKSWIFGAPGPIGAVKV